MLINPYAADEPDEGPGRPARAAGRALTVGALGLGAVAVFTGTGMAAETGQGGGPSIDESSGPDGTSADGGTLMIQGWPSELGDRPPHWDRDKGKHPRDADRPHILTGGEADRPWLPRDTGTGVPQGRGGDGARAEPKPDGDEVRPRERPRLPDRGYRVEQLLGSGTVDPPRGHGDDPERPYEWAWGDPVEPTPDGTDDVRVHEPPMPPPDWEFDQGHPVGSGSGSSGEVAVHEPPMPPLNPEFDQGSGSSGEAGEVAVHEPPMPPLNPEFDQGSGSSGWTGADGSGVDDGTFAFVDEFPDHPEPMDPGSAEANDVGAIAEMPDLGVEPSPALIADGRAAPSDTTFVEASAVESAGGGSSS